MTTFQSLGLTGEILEGVMAAGYQTPTPIQIQAIPAACEGRDLIGCAQTGTGKTAAFVLPMLQRLSGRAFEPTRGSVRALVVAPTRELALQVEESIRTYGRFTGLKSAAIFGGVSMEPQFQALRYGIDIVVATPGRLIDHMTRRTVDLSRLEILVLDEADRMFDMGFIQDLRRIVAATPREKQSLLFSATMPEAVQRLADKMLRDPQMIEIGQRKNPADTVDQVICPVEQDQKMDLLLHILENEPVGTVLVFSRTKHRADRIGRKLGQAGYATAVIHSNRTQQQRQRALDGLKKGRFTILVATDIAARGIDVDGISHVINFDTPNQPEDYIHRIGRTGRAEMKGSAITFVARDEEGHLRDIQVFTGKKLAQKRYSSFDYSYSDNRRYPAGSRLVGATAGKGSNGTPPRRLGQAYESAHRER